MSTTQTIVDGFAEVVDNEFIKLEYKKVSGDDYGIIRLIAKDTNSAFNGDVEFFMGTEDGMLIKQSNNVLANIRNDGFYISAPFYTNGGIAPTSSTDTGQAGEIRFDNNYLYRCIATDTWIRFERDTSIW